MSRRKTMTASMDLGNGSRRRSWIKPIHRDRLFEYLAGDECLIFAVEIKIDNRSLNKLLSVGDCTEDAIELIQSMNSNGLQYETVDELVRDMKKIKEQRTNEPIIPAIPPTDIESLKAIHQYFVNECTFIAPSVVADCDASSPWVSAIVERCRTSASMVHGETLGEHAVLQLSHMALVLDGVILETPESVIASFDAWMVEQGRSDDDVLATFVQIESTPLTILSTLMTRKDCTLISDELKLTTTPQTRWLATLLAQSRLLNYTDDKSIRLLESWNAHRSSQQLSPFDSGDALIEGWQLYEVEHAAEEALDPVATSPTTPNDPHKSPHSFLSSRMAYMHLPTSTHGSRDRSPSVSIRASLRKPGLGDLLTHLADATSTPASPMEALPEPAISIAAVPSIPAAAAPSIAAGDPSPDDSRPSSASSSRSISSDLSTSRSTSMSVSTSMSTSMSVSRPSTAHGVKATSTAASPVHSLPHYFQGRLVSPEVEAAWNLSQKISAWAASLSLPYRLDPQTVEKDETDAYGLADFGPVFEKGIRLTEHERRRFKFLHVEPTVQELAKQEDTLFLGEVPQPTGVDVDEVEEELPSDQQSTQSEVIVEPVDPDANGPHDRSDLPVIVPYTLTTRPTSAVTPPSVIIRTPKPGMRDASCQTVKFKYPWRPEIRDAIPPPEMIQIPPVPIETLSGNDDRDDEEEDSSETDESSDSPVPSSITAGTAAAEAISSAILNDPDSALSNVVGIGLSPGRLDLLGGVADYSGALCLEMPLTNAHTRVTIRYATLEEAEAMREPEEKEDQDETEGDDSDDEEESHGRSPLTESSMIFLTGPSTSAAINRQYLLEDSTPFLQEILYSWARQKVLLAKGVDLSIPGQSSFRPMSATTQRPMSGASIATSSFRPGSSKGSTLESNKSNTFRPGSGKGSAIGSSLNSVDGGGGTTRRTVEAEDVELDFMFDVEHVCTEHGVPTWIRYVLGSVLAAIHGMTPQHEYMPMKVIGRCLRIEVRSNVPEGCGVASSAALEVASMRALVDFANRCHAVVSIRDAAAPISLANEAIGRAISPDLDVSSDEEDRSGKGKMEEVKYNPTAASVVIPASRVSRAGLLAPRFGFPGTLLALNAQAVENQIVGAPCGLMDQLCVAHGKQGSILPILCRPDLLYPSVQLPRGVTVLGWPSGVKHALKGASPYSVARTAASMGRTILNSSLRACGKSPFVGAYLTELDMSFLRRLIRPPSRRTFLDDLPVGIFGASFFSLHEASKETMEKIDFMTNYPVRAAFTFPIEEHERSTKALELLEQANQLAAAQGLTPAVDQLLSSIGSLMYASHSGYSAMGLGDSVTDTMVTQLQHLAKLYPNHIYGARISGGGNGGTVVVLCRVEAMEKIRALCKALPSSKQLDLIS